MGKIQWHIPECMYCKAEKTVAIMSVALSISRGDYKNMVKDS